MIKLSDDIKVYVSHAPVDMRKSINGLTAIVVDVFNQPPDSRHLFLFYNKAKDKVKCIFWDRNGFVLYYKRLDKGRFKFNKASAVDIFEITEDQLCWLLAGLDFQLMQEFDEMSYANYY